MTEDNKERLQSMFATVQALEQRMVYVALRGKLTANVKEEMRMRVSDLYAKLGEIETS